MSLELNFVVVKTPQPLHLISMSVHFHFCTTYNFSNFSVLPRLLRERSNNKFCDPDSISGVYHSAGGGEGVHQQQPQDQTQAQNACACGACGSKLLVNEVCLR